MAEKIRYTRKDLKNPDEFITTFGRIVAWSKERRFALTVAAVCVAGVLALALGTRAYFQWQEAKASREIWPYLDQARAALSGPSPPDAARLASLEQSIATAVAMYPDSRAAVYGQCYLGSIAFHRGEYDRSLAHFREGLKLVKDAGVMKYFLREGVGNALEAKGDYPGAAAAYADAAQFAGGGLKVESQVSEARVLALSGKKSQADGLYKQILKENPKSGIRDLIEFKMAQLEE
jgi:tetratricopeptide (TPR) repeat protein